MGKKRPKPKAPKPASTVSESSLSDMDLIAAAICSATQTVFLKVCRLCESKDGPFLNIFDAEKVTAKKIDELMPFKIVENDDLPHKICFRCSAKVEEFHEFVQKCIKTQQSLCTALGKEESPKPKSSTRAIWEEKLNKSNISNDDICDALIKKAMEGIKDIPLNPDLLDNDKTPSLTKKEPKLKIEQPGSKKELKNSTDVKNNSDNDLSPKQLKLSLDKCDQKFIPTRTSRSQNPEALLDGLPDVKRTGKKFNKHNGDSKENEESSRIKQGKKKVVKISSSEDESSSDNEPELVPTPPPPSPPPPPPQKQKEEPKPKPIEPSKPFNIMDHVSTIKVNHVGVLFQCKLCNRNFLKKDVVLTHTCSKTGGIPKVDFTKSFVQPEPPRASVVKYINTKIDGELGKPVEKPIETPIEKPVENKTVNQAVFSVKLEVKKPIPESKPKPRIGPASRVRRVQINPIIGMAVAPIEEPPETPPPQPAKPPSLPVTPPASAALASAPSVQFPSIPSLNSRYKLVPGPNNTFQLVEEAPSDPSSDSVKSKTEISKPETSKSSKKRKSDETTKTVESKSRKQSEALHRNKIIPEVIDLEPASPVAKQKAKTQDQPYPVGLFSTLPRSTLPPHQPLPHHSSLYSQPGAHPPTFTTPAMKKQSYTIVQTGNPSKLLLSTKPPTPQGEETSKKRHRKSKHETKDDGQEKQPFKVTLEESVPPKDTFFTFINVDPLLQPSYVLPTDNIIQESQISTSTPGSKAKTDKDCKYSCNMCDEKFTREKKLLAHIHSHYNKMDEEDMLREKNKKRGKKSN